jgi:hypothetical protein
MLSDGNVNFCGLFNIKGVTPKILLDVLNNFNIVPIWEAVWLQVLDGKAVILTRQTKWNETK